MVITITFAALVCLTICPSTDAGIYFHRVGWVVGEPSYGHVHFTVNTADILNHLQTLQIAIASIRKQVHEIHHITVRNRAESFLRSAHEDISTMTTDFIDNLQILGHHDSNDKRQKRFIGLLVALGSLSVGLFNQAEILHLQSSVSNIMDQQNHMIDILQEHEIAIHNVQHDISKIRDGFLVLINEAEENHAMVKIHDAEIRIVMAIASLRRSILCIENGIEKLLTHRIPLCFLSTTHTKKALDRLSVKAKQNNLLLISPHTASFLQYETSFLLVKGQIQIFVHVPLVDPSRRLDLLKFSNAPIPISPTLSFALAPVQEYLAINREGLHATLSQADITTSKQYGEYFFSESAIPLRKHINQTCLGSIYSQNFQNLKMACPAVFIQTTETFTLVAPNEYVFTTRNPQTIQITCKGKTSHTAVQTEYHLKLSHPCEIATGEHVIRTGYDLSINEEVKPWPWNWNVTKHLFDLDVQTLELVATKLRLINNHPTPIRDLHHLIMSDTHQKLNLGLTIVISLISCILMFLLAYLAFRYFRLNNPSQKTPMVTSG